MMIAIQDQTILHTPRYTCWEKGPARLLIDPETPNWIYTDARGSRILGRVDGHRTFAEVVTLYARESQVSLAESWLHCHSFLKEALRRDFVALTPFVNAPYEGRATVLQPSHLGELWLHLNNSCNLACAHCLVRSSPQGEPGLAPEDWMRLAQEAVGLGVLRFYITGGEPLLRPDIWDLLTYLTTHADEVILLTNGLLLKGSRLEKLRAYDPGKLKLQISLDGSTPEVNDAVRGRGSFKGILQGIMNASGLGYAPTITTVVTRHNVQDVPSITRLCGELGCPNHHLLWLHLQGRAGEENEGLFVPVPELIEMVKKGRQVAQEVGVTLDNFEALRARLSGPRGVKLDLSKAGWESLCIFHDGHVYPSAALAGVPQLDWGSALESSLREVWLHSPGAHQIRAATVQKKATCHACHLKFLCGGGDVEHSFFYSRSITGEGTFLGPDPYSELYQYLLVEAMLDLGRENLGRNGHRSPFSAPRILAGMGDRDYCHLNSGKAHGQTPGDGRLPARLPGEFAVSTQHSNCVLSFELDKSRAPIREFYAQAAEEPQEGLCCPLSYDPEDLRYIPSEVLERAYGCGSPLGQVELQGGETVVDLGSGVGIDCFIAAKKVGPEGRVIGVDMTEAMLEQARRYQTVVAANLGYDVVEFRRGYLEEIPVSDHSVDLITSNCVINLSPDKRAVFREMARVLKPNGQFLVSDIVSTTKVPDHLAWNERLRGECLGGALTEDEFLEYLEQAGFYGLAVLRRILWRKVEGYQFLSVTVRGFKADPKPYRVKARQQAVYRGPFKAVMDEEGHLFPRNEPVEVSVETARRLQQPIYLHSFHVLGPDGEEGDWQCCEDGKCC